MRKATAKYLKGQNMSNGKKTILNTKRANQQFFSKFFNNYIETSNTKMSHTSESIYDVRYLFLCYSL